MPLELPSLSGRLLFFCGTLLVAGCSSKNADGARPNAPGPCKKFGDSCEFSPGKLGSCMERENCTQGNCLFCQSQH